MDWDAVASVASAVAALVALVGLLVTARSTRRQIAEQDRQVTRQLLEQRADVTRKHLADVSQQSRRIATQLADGGALISASWHTAGSVVAAVDLRGEPAHLVSATRHFLLGGATTSAEKSPESSAGGHSLLGVFHQGWEDSPSASALLRDVELLDVSASHLTGHFGLTATVAEMLVDMVNDVRMVMVRAIDDPDSGAELRKLLAEQYIPDDGPSEVVLLGLAEGIYGNLSSYVVARAYNEMVDALADLAGEVSGFAHAADGATVTRLAAARIIPPKSATRTQAMRTSIGRLLDEGSITSEVGARWVELVDVIERLNSEGRSPEALLRLQQLKDAPADTDGGLGGGQADPVDVVASPQ